MISFQAPLWLLLLALLPLIRWLHRFRQQSTTFPSTTLFLWQSIQHHKNSDGTLSTPDPHWLLRALFITLLLLSLAEPGLQTKNRPSIEVWLDDSLSMFVHEEKQQRIQMAIQQLQQYLLESEASAIQVHSLGNPALLLELDPRGSAVWPARLSEWTSQPRGEPSPPPAATLSPDNNHILLTDGADLALNKWVQSAPLQHVIQVGKKTQNIALTLLSLRQPLNNSDKLNGLVRIDNLGKNPLKPRLILQHKEQVLEVQKLDLPASAKTLVTFTIPAEKQNGLHARLEGVDDPLPLDDSLQLETEKLRPLIRYEQRGNCSPYVLAALDSHPALIQDKNQVDVIIDCSETLSDHASESEQPTLRFHPPRSITQTTQAAHWHKNLIVEPLRMAAGLPYSNDAPALNTGSIPILSADSRLLILKQEESTQTIDSYLDINDPVFARQPEYPLLILSLIEQVTGQSLDIAPLTASREINASRITPFTLSGISASPGKTGTTQKSFTPILLLASLLVLLLDAIIASGLATIMVHKFGKQNT